MNIAVIFAGGTGKRIRSTDRPKQFISVVGKPIIVHTIEKFQYCSSVDKIVISCLDGWIDYAWDMVRKYNLTKVVKIVPGGETGQESIYHGLLAARVISDGVNTTVLIHDGVRPMISSELIEENIRCVEKYGSAITCGLLSETPVTIKEGNAISKAVSRDVMRVAKAPQSFRLDDVLAAHEKAIQLGKTAFIDTCSLMSYFDYPCRYIECGSDNIKVTTMEDLSILWALLQAKDHSSTSCEDNSDNA